MWKDLCHKPCAHLGTAVGFVSDALDRLHLTGLLDGQTYGYAQHGRAAAHTCVATEVEMMSPRVVMW